MPKKKQDEQGDKPTQVEYVAPAITTPTITRRSEVAQMVPTLYANGFQVVLGPLDIRLHVIETFPASPTEIIDRRLLSIIMAPETLKLLAANLPKYVELYEKEFGKLRDIQTGDKARAIISPGNIS